jgi:hypothetical protein
MFQWKKFQFFDKDLVKTDPEASHDLSVRMMSLSFPPSRLYGSYNSRSSTSAQCPVGVVISQLAVGLNLIYLMQQIVKDR